MFKPWNLSAWRWAARVGWRELVTITLALAVLASMVGAAQSARKAGDRYRRVETLVERVRGAGQEIAAITWEGLAQGENSDPMIVPRGFGAWAQLSGSLATLRDLAPGEQTAGLDRAAAAIYSAGMRAMTAGEDSEEASNQITTRYLRPALVRFNAAAERAAARAHKESDRQWRRAGTAFVGSLAAGLCLLMLLGWHLQLMRRRAAIAESRRAIERRSEERLRALVEHAGDAVSVVDSDLRVLWQSASVRQILGREAESLVGSPITELIHPEDAATVQQHLDASAQRAGHITFSARFEDAAGAWRHLETIAENRLDDPAVGGLVLSMRDVTERKALEDELRHQAFHDALTGLANRALFEDRLVHAIAGSRRHGHRLAVLFVDLDDFKTINDGLGHVSGDELLVAVAQRVAETVRPADTAARIGGDEFAVLIELLEDELDAHAVASRILEALAPPFQIGGRELRIAASIGVAIGDGRTHDAEALLRNADTAMYAAKESGKGTVELFDERMYQRALTRLELSGELQAGLREGQFELDYQPIVDLHTGRIVSTEALVRWRHPTRGLLAPGHFIALTEETGLIVPLGNWILETACAQAQTWRSRQPDLTVSVNVSPRQLHDPHFRNEVSGALERSGLDPAGLVLEMTETVLSGDPDVVAAELEALKALGVRIAVDDFGTGYSALSRLQQFSIDILKIDRSFVDGIERDPAKAKLVESIIGLGGTLHLDVIAEGIELEAQASQLLAMHSSMGQGFLFSRPVQASAIQSMLDGGAGFPRRVRLAA